MHMEFGGEGLGFEGIKVKLARMFYIWLLSEDFETLYLPLMVGS